MPLTRRNETNALVSDNVADQDFYDHPTVGAAVDAAVERSRTEPAEAAGELRSLAAVAGRHGWHDLEASATYALARVVLGDGRVADAIELIDEAAAAFRAAGDDLGAIRTGLGRMHALDDLGRHHDAAAAAEAMLLDLDALVTSPETDWLRAAALGNLGVAYGFIGRHEDAIDAHASSAAVFERLDLDHERGVADANRAIELLALGRARQSTPLFDAALATFERHDDGVWAAKCRAHRADALVQLGALREAIADVELGREALRGSGARTESARLALTAARARLGLGQPDAAIAALDAALPDLADLEHDRAVASLIRGLAERQRGDDAAPSLQRALEGLSAVGDESGAMTASIALADTTEDAAGLRRAVEAARAADRPIHLVSAAVALADHGDGAFLDEASAIVDSLGLPTLRAAIALRRGNTALVDGVVDRAIEEFRTSWEQSISLRERLGHEALRLAFHDGRRRALDGMVTALLRRDSPEDRAEALRAVDADRSRTLIEQRATSSDDAALRPESTERDDRRADLGAAYSALFEAGLSRTRASLIHDRIEELERTIAELDLRAGARAPISPREASPAVVDRADDHDAIVFHTLDTRIVAFVESRSGIAVRELERARVTEAVARMDAAIRSQVRGRAHATNRTAPVDRALRDVELAILAPLVEDLDPNVPLAIVPDIGLLTVPFHAFSSIADRPVATIPSLGALPAAARPVESPRVVVVGVADDSTPNIGDEVSEVARRWPDATVLLNGDATVAAVSAALTGADLVHLACHGLHRPDDPTRSALRLSDGWLDTGDLRRASLAADALVVLSACESGRAGGHEAYGLAHGVLGAGAAACIVSGWPVDDTETARFMASLHARLAAGTPAGEALQSTRADHRTDSPLLADWASFALVGDPRR